MKKQINLAIFGLVLFSLWSCEKNQVEPVVDNQEVILYRISGDKNEVNVVPIKVENITTNNNSVQSLKSQNSSANGHYTQPNGRAVSFSAVENGGGVHGNALFQDDFLFYHVKIKIEQIFVVGNQAYAAGPITQFDALEFEVAPPGYPGLGYWLVMAVEDNGEGANALPDKCGPGIFSVDPATADLIVSLGLNLPQIAYAQNIFSGPAALGPGLNPTNIQVN